MAEKNKIGNLKGYIEILRPGWWPACFFIGLTPGMLAIFWSTGSLNEFFQWTTLLWAFAYWISIVGIYVFNDVVGEKEDEIINPKRPVPAGAVGIQSGLIYSAILLTIGIVIWWFMFRNPLSSGIQLMCIALIAVYSAVYKNNILLGLGAGLIPVGVWIAFAPFHTMTIALFLIVLFWEMSLDVPENLLHYEGDIRIHPHTFAISLGREKFAQIGLTFAIPAVVASIWLFILLDMSLLFLVFALLASLALIFGINSIRNNLSPMSLGRSLGMTMLFIILINLGTISHTIVYSL
jgi:4-hydroxybenzoate polyprenyltransferase